MHFFARAVITGFGFTLGSLLLRKAAKRLGIEDPMYPTMPAKTDDTGGGGGDRAPASHPSRGM